MNSTNTVVANAMAARNAAPKGLTQTTKLRLKEDFSDEYGSYRKGDIFPMYAMGGINPRFGTMTVPGREVTLQIPWEKLEVVNAVAANAIGDLDFDMKGVYETAKKMIAVGATHKGGYHWSIPKTYAVGAGVVASRVGGTVKVVRDDPDRAGFVIAEITDPLAQALERKGVPNAKRVARNADRLEEKSFGNGDVKASMKDFGRDPIYEIAVYTTGITSAVSFADKGKKCVAEARAVLSAVERKASALKQAIAWMEQNAKAW